jgi:hypothetical protein
LFCVPVEVRRFWLSRTFLIQNQGRTKYGFVFEPQLSTEQTSCSEWAGMPILDLD